MGEHTAIEAEFRSKCAVCGEWIEEGDKIVCDEDGNWIHSDCEEPPYPGMVRTAHGWSRPCSLCNSTNFGNPCSKSEDGYHK
jgi:hypothetical protein